MAENQRQGHDNLGAISEVAGFLSMRPLVTCFPNTHEAWDRAAANLPTWTLDSSVVRHLAAIPSLSASQADLPDEYLARASLILGILVGAYRASEGGGNANLPAAISAPWRQVSKRLGRSEPVLSYGDWFLSNYVVLDLNRSDPMRLSNLELLAPVFGNDAERIFVLTQVEITAQCAPIVGAIVRAHEAIAANDACSLQSALSLILDRLQHVTNHSLLKIDANPLSQNFVDPVVWAKTVGRFLMSANPGAPGSCGTSSPLFLALDAFFGRGSHDSEQGEATLRSLKSLSPHHLQFVEAIGQVSVREYVASSPSPDLKGVFQSALDAYVGENGFLGAHRQKVYGYLEVAAKVAANPNGQRLQDRDWLRVNAEMDRSRLERVEGVPAFCQFGRVVSSGPTDKDADDRIKRIVVETGAAGLAYVPGDRLSVLPENSPDLVEKTLQSLQATGTESIRFDAVWKSAWPTMFGVQTDGVTLAELLRYAKIRPVDLPVAKALFRLTVNARLQKIIRARAEDQWELWELLDALTENGFDPRRLWKAEPWEPESICKIAPPPLFRPYPISSAPSRDSGTAETIELTIGELDLHQGDSALSRAGTLMDPDLDPIVPAPRKADPWTQFEEGARLTLRVVHPSRFQLPIDSATPIVMFANGAGIAPFRSFLIERTKEQEGGANWLFFGTRGRHQFLYRSEMEQWVREGRLDLRIAFSNEEIEAVWDASGGRYHLSKGSKAYVAHLMESNANAERLWNLMRSREEGGEGARFYVCGTSGFAMSILNSLRSVVARFMEEGDELERDERARHLIYRMVAEQRYMQDVSSTYVRRDEDERTYDVSEMIFHNSPHAGYWSVIDGKVYDLSTFFYLHAGGDTILRQNVGMDATDAYRAVKHHLNPETDAMLSMFQIGSMRPIDFANAWGVAIGSNGLRYVSVESAFRSWSRFAYLIVELENALLVDLSALGRTLVKGDDANRLSRLKINTLVETHRRFMKNCMEGALDPELMDLWSTTIGLCAPSESVLRLERDLASVVGGVNAATAATWVDHVLSLVDRIDSDDESVIDELERQFQAIQEIDLTFLFDLKRVIRSCLIVFESYGKDTVARGSQELVETMLTIPPVFERFYESLAEYTGTARS
ncbi:MAG: cytochrome b5 domain-containing protein [Fimbriimonas sp.]|nr:cytochrome b5 domain-containing protein [Fimbriimonas sp.]